MPKPSRQGESYEQFTPIEANKLRIKQVFEHLSDLCNSTVAYLEERIVCPPLIDLIRKSFDKWDLECLKSLIEFSKKSGRNYGSEKKLVDEFLVLKADSYLKFDRKILNLLINGFMFVKTQVFIWDVKK